MPATRLQAKAHIATKITDPKNYQNTATLVREVLEYVMLHCFVLAEDEVTIQQVKDLATTLSTKADLVAGKVPASQLPAFSAYWGAMAKAADNAQTVEQAIAAAVAAVVNASPAQLDTLNELAAALGNDANFAATVNAAIAAKIPTTEKGAANGVATLDATGKVPGSQLPFTDIAANQFGTHPAFNSQYALNAWLLSNAGTTTPDNTPPTSPQGTVISDITTSGYTATATPSTDIE